MARTVYTEENKIESQPTAVKGLVLASWTAPGEQWQVYMQADRLHRAGSLLKAKERMRAEGWYACDPEAFQRTIMSERQGWQYLEPEDLIWDPEAITAEILFRDTRGLDGFVYRYGREIPLSTPINDFLCASSWNLTEEVIKAMLAHPWIRTSGETYYVPHNGTSLNFQVLLPQGVWDELYAEVKPVAGQHFSSSNLMSAMLHGYPVNRDLLGLQEMLRKPERDPHDDDEGADDDERYRW